MSKRVTKREILEIKTYELMGKIKDEIASQRSSIQKESNELEQQLHKKYSKKDIERPFSSTKKPKGFLSCKISENRFLYLVSCISVARSFGNWENVYSVVGGGGNWASTFIDYAQYKTYDSDELYFAYRIIPAFVNQMSDEYLRKLILINPHCVHFIPADRITPELAKIAFLKETQTIMEFPSEYEIPEEIQKLLLTEGNYQTFKLCIEKPSLSVWQAISRRLIYNMKTFLDVDINTSLVKKIKSSFIGRIDDDSPLINFGFFNFMDDDGLISLVNNYLLPKAPDGCEEYVRCLMNIVKNLQAEIDSKKLLKEINKNID